MAGISPLGVGWGRGIDEENLLEGVPLVVCNEARLPTGQGRSTGCDARMHGANAQAVGIDQLHAIPVEFLGTGRG